MNSKDYYQANKEHIKARVSEYQKANRVTKTAYQKAWKQAHPDLVAGYRATEYDKFTSDPEKVALHNKRNLNNYHRTRQAIFEILGKECQRCGFSDMRALQVDHIYGGGGKQRALCNSLVYFRQILADPQIKDKYQTLCANCNWIKRAENNENSRKVYLGGTHELPSITTAQHIGLQAN